MMAPVNESEVLTNQGMIRLWLHEAGMMNSIATAIALHTIALEILRNCAIVGEASEGSAEKSSNDVISSDGLNLVNISHDFS